MAQLPPKKEVCQALLNGPSVYVHIDPRRDGVAVPQWFKKQAQLVLQIGLNMAVPIPDLDVGDDGITCTLSFNRSPFWCSMPWTAVYALVGEDGRGMIWPDDVPAELASQTNKPNLKVVGTKKKKEKKKGQLTPLAAVVDLKEDDKPEEPIDPKPTLAAVPNVDESPLTDGDDDKEKKDGKKLPPYLRVIK